ncbi:yjeF N-terminal domain-containing protein 3-like [Sinocyclocheilus rhinocerous]|uniref:yjeF N-terminal domain-containing protein 3-like n=1 Tax=Sinocyclocheilus rhinocerous TaxID=307959 RepID=UPI0007B8BD7D|nr:PREDICTED: yjeF N-terminal domain-containing protein 3-like [Sinocyclocheilus rhinocerous]
MNHSSNEKEPETIEPLRYLSKTEVATVETELLRDYRFGQQQLIEIWGHACAIAITKVCPTSEHELHYCEVGGQNGSIGLVCARHLRMFEYEPTIFYPKRSPQSLHQDFTIQCEKMDIPFLSYLPTEVQLLNDAYNLVIDAILGPETDHKEVKEPYAGMLVTLKQVKIPIVSVDVPSGICSLNIFVFLPVAFFSVQ